jgi:Mor family transcriptional regulator
MKASTMTQAAQSPAREESNALFLQREMQDILKVEIGMHDEFSTGIAAALVRGWRKRAGGQRIYIPSEPKNETRNSQIKQEFKGDNRAEICKKYNISPSRLYQIVND